MAQTGRRKGSPAPRKKPLPKKDAATVVRMTSKSGATVGEGWGVVQNAKKGKSTFKAVSAVRRELGDEAAKKYAAALRSIKKRSK